MAKNVTVQLLGGKANVVSNVDTVKEAIEAAGLEGNFTATINGEQASMGDDLKDFQYVNLAAAVKGGIL